MQIVKAVFSDTLQTEKRNKYICTVRQVGNQWMIGILSNEHILIFRAVLLGPGS